MGNVCCELVAVVLYHRLCYLNDHIRYCKRAEERGLMKSYILLLLCVLLTFTIIQPASAGVAQIMWTKTIGQCVTAIDTNPTGTLILVGLGNGSIFAYDQAGNITWTNATNSTATKRAIKKIVADPAGNIAWISEANESGFIAFGGTVGGIVRGTGRNMTDVAIEGDGTGYATTELNPPRLALRNINGTPFIQNTSFGTNTYWTKIGYDPSGTWIVTANASSNALYFWNLTTYVGWDEFNPLHTPVKNSSQIFIDSFPYRQNISVEGSGNKGLTFKSTTNTTYIQKLNNSYYEYNPANTGNYFYWTLPGKISNDQRSLLTSLVINGVYYSVILTAGNVNYTIYYGNTTFNNFYDYIQSPFTYTSGCWTSTNGTHTTVMWNATGTSSWTPPTGVTSVEYLVVAGGGGGGSYAGGGGGGGGVLYNTLSVSGSYSIVVGAGGSGGGVGVKGSSGSNSSFGSYIAIGGGGGGGTSGNALNGGSGGGAKGTVWGVGTSGQGQRGGYGYVSQSGQNVGGGGGGNATVGGNASGVYIEQWQEQGGNGGTGFTTSISGSSVQYACGGGGGVRSNGYEGEGGCVGAGKGAGTYYNVHNGVAGSVNTGSGGGGSDNSGSGGNGGSGVVIINYLTPTSPITVSHLFSQQIQFIASAINQTSTKFYTGNILGISVPAASGIASIITDTIFYQQYMTSYGFGVSYSATLSNGAPALFAGTPFTVSTSNSGTASIEGRGAYANIYDAGGVAKASSLTGGTIRSADSAMSSGVFAVFGGDEGKVYMLSREGSSTWYSYYTGSADTPINAVAVLWDGSGVVVGRFGGTLEYYNTNVTIPVTPTIAPNVEVSVYAFKDGAAYQNQLITIYSSATAPSGWVPVGAMYTDTSGRISYSSTVGAYYKFVVNNVVGTTSGEGETIWQSNTASPTVYVYVISPSTPYEWNAYYNPTNNNVTVVYSDSIVPTSITITIKDLKTNINVMTRTILSTPNFILEYHDDSGIGSYQVGIVINRMGGSVRDQRMVTSPKTYGITFPNDSNITYAASTIILMLAAGLFSYAHSKRGALAVVVLAVVMMVFRLLPWTTGMVAVVGIAAMFAVLSLFASRVQ